MTISDEVISMLQIHAEIWDLCDFLHDEYINNTEQFWWVDIKHMPIYDVCMWLDLDDIKKIVNEYGVLEIKDRIKGIYGDKLIISILEKEEDMRYRSLFYYILDEYINYLKFEDCWGDTDDEEEEEEVDSDIASDAETDEEN